VKTIDHLVIKGMVL